jgi:hypothetical protein
MKACASAAQCAGRRWLDADGVHIDVRGLAPPQPLVAILRLLHEQGDAAAAVIVHHDRDPLLLYPELAQIGWVAERIAAEPGEVRLRLLGPQSPRAGGECCG